MEAFKEIEYMLELIDRPAFCVRDDAVCFVNAAAAGLLITVGQPISDMLGCAQEEYRQMTHGVLYLPVEHNGVTFTASVKRMDSLDLFVLESQQDQEQLQVMALAAMQFREPLSDVMAVLARMLPEEKDSPTERGYRGTLNRRLLQMHRLVCNMSDVARYTQEQQETKSCCDICAVVEEFFRRAEDLAAAKSIQVQWNCPKEQILTMLDVEKLERGFYNMVSNAMKFTPEGGRIALELTRRSNRLYLSVRDWGEGIPSGMMGSVYTRFRRQPGLEDSRHGLGVGFSLICAAAAAHGGTVLIDSPEGGGTRVTMSLVLRQDRESVLRSRKPAFDYAGETDHALLELADALPPKAW